MSDLLRRLFAVRYKHPDTTMGDLWNLCEEASAEIERLRAENEQLRAENARLAESRREILGAPKADGRNAAASEIEGA